MLKKKWNYKVSTLGLSDLKEIRKEINVEIAKLEEKEPCEYCKEEKPEKILKYDTDFNGEIFVEIKGNYLLLNEVLKGVKTKINYCPKCARPLRGEKNG